MTHRTTGLAGTFALMCVVHAAAAQSYTRPRVGMIVAAPNQPALQSRWVGVVPQRAAVRLRAGSSPRIAMIVPAPAQPQVQAWGGREASQGFSSVQPAGQFYPRTDPRPVRRSPPQAMPEQTSPNRLQAARRGASTARGNKPRIGLVVPGPPAEQDPFFSTVFARNQNLGFVQVAQFYYLPAVMLTDGRVFANFNGSYEEVLRRCPALSGPMPPGFTTSACWMIDSYGRYTVVQPR